MSLAAMIEKAFTDPVERWPVGWRESYPALCEPTTAEIKQRLLLAIGGNYLVAHARAAERDHECFRLEAEVAAHATPPDSDAVRADAERLSVALLKVRTLLDVEYHDDGRIASVGHASSGLREMVHILDDALYNQGSSSNGK